MANCVYYNIPNKDNVLLRFFGLFSLKSHKEEHLSRVSKHPSRLIQFKQDMEINNPDGAFLSFGKDLVRVTATNDLE